MHNGISGVNLDLPVSGIHPTEKVLHESCQEYFPNLMTAKNHAWQDLINTIQDPCKILKDFTKILGMNLGRFFQ